MFEHNATWVGLYGGIDAVVPTSFEVVWSPRIAGRVYSHRVTGRYGLPASDVLFGREGSFNLNPAAASLCKVGTTALLLLVLRILV